MKYLRTEYEIDPYVFDATLHFAVYEVEIYKTFWGNERRFRELESFHDTRELARSKVERTKTKKLERKKKEWAAMNKMLMEPSEVIR